MKAIWKLMENHTTPSCNNNQKLKKQPNNNESLVMRHQENVYNYNTVALHITLIVHGLKLPIRIVVKHLMQQTTSCVLPFEN